MQACDHRIGDSFRFSCGQFFAWPAQAQGGPAQPAAQDVASNPIGKVVATTGSVTIEHVNAVIVQANLPSQAGQAKVGDLVYQGDVVRTEADGRVSINFTDGTSFNLLNNAQHDFERVRVRPGREVQLDLVQSKHRNVHFCCWQLAKTGDMKIDTPVATMGIRGTTQHVEISDVGTVKFSTLLEEGKSKLRKGHPRPSNPNKTRSQAQFEHLSRVLGLPLRRKQFSVPGRHIRTCNVRLLKRVP